MKTGKSLIELATEVQRQQDSKRDYLADTRALEMVPVAMSLTGAEPTKAETVALAGINGEPLALRRQAHAQIASRVQIPKAYYDRMLDAAPELLASNVNHWFQTQPERRMVRTLDGTVRAFLSDRYRALDNFDLLQAALPVLKGMNTQFASAEVTEPHLYLKVIFPELETVIKGSKQVGDVVQAGLVISNSEIGMSSLRVEPFFHRLICTNGMISNYATRKYHVGRGHDVEDQVAEILRDETREQLDRGFWMKIQDVIRTAVSRDVIEAQVQRFENATQQRIEGNPVKVVEVARKSLALPESMQGDILKNLIDWGDLSQWGLANAITRVANEAPDYEDATALERAGGKVIELSQREWSSISTAS